MPFPKWLAIIALATLPLATFAQRKQTPNPADPNATVPAVGYVSAIGSYQRTADDEATPDTGWRAANDAIAGADGQGHHAAHAMPGGDTPASPKADAPQAPQAPARSATNPHAGHHSEGK